MKKFLTVLLIFVLVIGIIAASPKSINASSGIKVLLDGQELKFDVAPQIIEGRTLLPLRTIFEALGLEVGWDDTTRMITGTTEGKEIILKLDSVDATVNGAKQTLDVPAKAINGRTLVPVRFIAESLGIMVDWNPESRTVIINKDDEIISFKDSNFEQAVRSKIKKPLDSIYKSDVEKITSLIIEPHLNNTNLYKINDIEGIQSLINLKELVIKDNTTIKDLSPIMGLSNLRELAIYNSDIISLEPLKKLINLEQLRISDSKVNNIIPLTNLLNLKSLHLEGNNISDISALEKLARLEYLNLSHNDIYEIDILKNMINLEIIGVSHTKVSDVCVLMYLPKLIFADVSDIPVAKIDFAKVYQPLFNKGVGLLTSYDEAELLSIKIEKELRFDDIDAVFHIDELLKALPISEYAKLFVDNSDYSREFDSLRLKETEYYEKGNISFDFHDKNELSAYFNIGIQSDKNFNYLKDKIKEKYGRPFTEDVKEDAYGDAKITRWAGGIELRRYPGYRQDEDKRTQLWVIKKRSTGDNKYDNELSVQEIKAYLASDFGTLDTNIGTTKLTYNIHENKNIYSAYDYWVQVGFEFEFFSMAMNSIEYTNEQKTILRSELKQHQKNIGEALIRLLPNKKLYGGYYKSWYRYPNLRVDLITRRYYSWTNYDEPEWGLDISDYEQTKPSYFRWYDLIDDRL